jgi:hypothetical protein
MVREGPTAAAAAEDASVSEFNREKLLGMATTEFPRPERSASSSLEYFVASPLPSLLSSRGDSSSSRRAFRFFWGTIQFTNQPVKERELAIYNFRFRTMNET